MRITVNGKTVEIAEKTSLGYFVLSRGLVPEGVIAELNERVVPRDAWTKTLLVEGDCMELVSLVGGG
jgi:sulfur carrier protein